MTAFDDNKFAIVFEDRREVQQNNAGSDHHSHASQNSDPAKDEHTEPAMNHSKANMDHSKMDMDHSTSGATSIVLQLYENGNLIESRQLTGGKKPDHHAVISTDEDNLFVAWIHESGDKASIQYTRIAKP